MGLPKRRHSPTRGKLRQAHDFLKRIDLSACPRCSHMKPPHTVCPNCGTYKNEEVLPPSYEK
ncbi:MAG: 50S ribosomal protein L32 [Candidatus Brocadiia bacterium]